MNILLSTSECVPFAKTGGLADVSGALPKALKQLKHDVRVIMPKYKTVDVKKFGLKTIAKNIPVILKGRIELVSVMEGKIALKSAAGKTSKSKGQQIPVYFIESDKYFGRDELYRTAEGDYEDNGERFSLFSRAVLEVAKAIGFKPDVIHCNDWQTGIIPAYLKTLYKLDSFFLNTATLYTIHNIAYQGIFNEGIFHFAGFDWWDFTPEKMEYYGQVNFMKSALRYAEILNTVSKNYSSQIQSSEEFGRGMEALLSERKDDLFGIINGLDYDEWNPQTDKNITTNYSLAKIEEKALCKKDLQNINKLPNAKNIPLIGLISRLDDQKGFDILSEAMDELMKMDVQIIILGTGDQKYMELVKEIGVKYPKKVGINLKFDNTLAHKIYAGSDMFLVPSRFEPCGLGQLISFAYGTVPIVHKTGGLADTVNQFNAGTGKGTGFLFEEYSSKNLISAVTEAIAAYKNKKSWSKLIQNGMKADFSWAKAAKEYVGLYKKAQQKKIESQIDLSEHVEA